MGNDITPEAIKRYREVYPKKCSMCDGDLEGPPDTDDEIVGMIEEHDRLFPGQPIQTSQVICDTCFQAICPGGNVLSMQ